MIIRPYRPADRDKLYEICLLTGADGEDASQSYVVPTLLGEVYVGPYLEFSPDLAWVAEQNGEPAGYVLGADDTWSFEMHCEAEWWPALRAQYPLGSQSSSADSAIVDLIHRPPTAEPGVLASYPAHLHIDLLPSLQGHGAGRALIGTLLAELTSRRVPGVHLGVSLANVRAVGFYQHLGFSTVRVGADYFILGKRLDDH